MHPGLITIHTVLALTVVVGCVWLDLKRRLSPIPFASLVAVDYLFFYALYPALGSYIVDDLVVPRHMSPSTIALTLAAELLLIGFYYGSIRNSY